MYGWLYMSGLLRQKQRRKVISPGSDWMRLAVIMGVQRPPPKKRQHTFSRYLMKPSENESLHRPDHEMVCDRSFFGCITPDRIPQNSSDDVTKVY